MSRPFALFLLAVFVSLGCPEVQAPPASPQQPAAAEPVVWRMSKSGLGFRIGDADGARADRSAKAIATPLSDDDAKRVLARLPPLPDDPSERKDFALRDRSQPAPRPGKTIRDAFPPPATAPPPSVTAQSGPLTITRRSPTGSVELAPFLSVSFSAPMVAVTSHDDLSRTPPPVVLTPEPPGKWRWVGAQTVVFDPDKRFPMATEYTVKVPAGTRAANGQTLAKDETWGFATPPPKLVSSWPHSGPQGLDPVIYVELDQAMDREVLLRQVELTGGGSRVEMRAATDEEIAKDPAVRRWIDKAEPGRAMAFKASGELSRGVSYSVTLPKGTPSAEGPRQTAKDQRFGFYTYRKLASSGLRCGWRHCPPGSTLRFSFNNPLDEGKFDRAWVRVHPEPAAMRISVSGSGIDIRGRTRGKTKYTVTVAGALADAFGQTLGHEVSADVTVDPAEPQLFGEESEMSILDPSGSPSLPVFSVNRPSLNVKLYAVQPGDWAKYEAWRAAWDDDEKKAIGAPPGRLVRSSVVRPSKTPDELATTMIDLAPALKNGLGQAIVVVEPSGPIPRERWKRQWLRTWVQVTRIGVEVLTDADSMVAWTTKLADGAPLAGVDVSIAPVGPGSAPPGARSGVDGLARLALGDVGKAMLIARSGDDVTILPDRHRFDRRSTHDAIRWLVIDDRHTYKPGEEIHVKGWLRRVGGARGGDVGAVPNIDGRTIAWTIHDARSVEIAKGTSVVDARGGFDLASKLPATPNLGQARLSLTLEGSPIASGKHSTHRFSIEEFRRPEFEVSARTDGGPFFVGGHTNVTASATYYAGGGLPNAEVAWQVSRSDARFVPPNRSAYAFGKAASSWWIDRARAKRQEPETWTGRTGPSGEHRVRLDIDALDPPYPMSLSCQATITDVNRQAWTATTTLLVHPADVYVGLKQDRGFVKAGEALALDAIVADVDGKIVPGRAVRVKSARVGWERKQGEYVEVESDVATCDVTSGSDASKCSLSTKAAGKYRVSAIVTDAHGRKNKTETHVWVMGASDVPDSSLPRDRVQMIPEKQSVQVGDTAEILLVAPFAPAEGALVIERQGIVKIERFHMDTTSQTIRFAIDPAWVPNVSARVVLLGAAPREGPNGEVDPSLAKRPAFASGSIGLDVPPRDRALSVKATPRDAKLDPGGRTDVDVEVRDAKGEPAAGASVALIVVDESVLALSSYKTPDPIAAFYAHRSSDVRETSTYARVLVARPDDKRLSAKESARNGRDKDHSFNGGGLMGGMKMKSLGARPAPSVMAKRAPRKVSMDEEAPNEAPAIAVRKDLGALALFAPALLTDQAGRVSASVKLPDNLTRYRVMAIVAHGEREFGSGESSITARLPLMVRPSAPRFLNYGDRFELPIVLQNQTDAELTVDVAARASNAALTAGAGRRVKVPANDRVEVRLPAAAQKPGKARFQIGAASGRYADAAEVSLPVWTPATTEAFATYGVVDEGAIAQPVKMPSAVEPSFGGIEITTSSTALSALTDAVLYLVRYPFECNEQISSRVLALAALRDVVSAFNAKEMPSKEVLAASMARDIEKLRARQHWSGGWDFWRRDREPWPYLSVHVAHALVRAKEKGYAVPANTIDAAKRYLRAIDGHIPRWYSGEARRAIVAYALYVRHRMADADPDRARKLVAEAGGVEKLSMEAVGWIWPTLSADAKSTAELAEVRRVVQNRATETAGAAHFATSYSDGSYVLLHSDRRADGILLESMIGDQPKSDIIPKLVTGLLAHRKRGRWTSTQENAFVLVALDRYFQTYEKTTPDFVARAWLGDRYAGEHAFKGRSGDRHEIDIPMRALAEVGSGDVILSKTGAGRLYYRVGMTYAPSDLKPPPAEHGFTVTRLYESVDDPGDVRRDPDGTWRVKAGSKVRVRINLVAPTRRYHVALVDPIPAGLEVMNPALAVTGAIPADPKAAPRTGWWWRATWYEHQNIRDERVEAFASLLWDGVYDYTYVARATTPGTFVVPPPKAEEMYSPETFGRGAGDKLVVE